MMQFRFVIFLVSSFVFLSSGQAQEITVSGIPECSHVEEFDEITPVAQPYDKSLLWKVSKNEGEESYVFGTIHVADEDIVDLPDEVLHALNHSTTFAMEVVPEPEELLSVAGLMYFSDGQKLSDLVSPHLFQQVLSLLSSYHLPEDAIKVMKPWAAYLTMSYPPEFGEVLDLQLLAKARKNGAKLIGLESLQEQLSLFNNMTLANQLKLLSDTVCNYDLIETDFVKMKQLYKNRDLNGLYNYSLRYSLDDNHLYQDLIDKLLVQRNYRMTERMQSMLEEGSAFIAIGAMHLPGNEGVLSLLEKNNYKITPVY